MKNAIAEQSQPFDEVETLSELLRFGGKDEMNLAEFPMTSLSDRPVTSETSLKFEDQIYDDRKKKLVTRKRIIEGSKEYGLPTATDDSVILALIQLTKLKNGFTTREVTFTRHELISLLSWPNKGQSYDRIAQSLHRLAGVTYHFENSWWDNRRKAWTTKIFGIIDTVELNDSRETDGQGGLFPSQIIWNQIILDSFQAGYLRSLDFQLCMNLKHAISMRIYRFMGKRFHLKSDWTLDLKDFAYEHIGLSRNYEGGTQIARKLQPAIEELETVGFLEPMTEDERYLKKGRSWSIRFIKKPLATSPLPVSTGTTELVPSSLVTELTNRGVTKATAEGLLPKHPAEFIQLKLDVFDWLVEKQDKRIAQNPAGYLVKSINDDYAAPKGFISKAEQQRRQEAQQARDRKAAEDRRRQQDQEAREKAERQAIDAYWASLTPEQQAELDAASIAEADPETLAMERGPMKKFGQTLRRHGYIRKLLASQEQKQAEA
jgi:Replication initiator protein A